MVRDHVPGAAELTVWRSDTSDDIRVYIDGVLPDHRGYERDIKYCYYATGNARNAPRSLSVPGRHEPGQIADVAMLKIICAHAARLYKRVNINLSQALATDYVIPAMPADLVEAIQERSIKS